MIHEFAAIGAALCWAATGLLSQYPAQVLGPFAFNRLRQGAVALLLAAVVFLTGRWHGVTVDQFQALAISGVIGIFLGDLMLYFSLLRLGPRRAGALFALNAPISALLGWAFLDEKLSIVAGAGVALASAGVAIAVLGRPGRSGTHRFEAVRGPLWIGMGLGVMAALGQAIGSIVVRPVMASGFDPIVASTIRLGVAVICLILLMLLPFRALKAQGPMTSRVATLTIMSGVLAMGVGMTLLLFALQGGKVGIVATLSALSPVLILPIIWAITGARPSATSWLGALIAVIGMALIFLG